jgi:isopentenyl-diphosphate Delta-isomerase
VAAPVGPPGSPGPRGSSPGETIARKRDHLRIALTEEVGFSRLTTGLETLQLASTALPERNLADVDLSVQAFGRRLGVPVMISCMTGGVSEAGAVNKALATAGQAHGVAVGLGSGRVVLEDDTALASFRVRDVAPDVVLLANLGAVQLHTYTPADCARLVERCEADVLVLHLNAVQEGVQPGGDTEFAGLLRRIEELCATLEVPVVVKEVGFGLAPADVRRLTTAGVAGVDVAGAGGTNWARVEGFRDTRAGAVADAFADWGWPTADALRGAREALDGAGSHAILIASGGLRDGVDVLKCLALGADLAAVGAGLLAAAADGPDAATEAVGVIVDQLRIAAWACGIGASTEITPALLRAVPTRSTIGGSG